MTVGAGNRSTQAANSLAEHAKQLCSGVFVVGRNPYEFVRNDLRTIDHYHDWDRTSVDVDFEERTVTLTDDESNERTAVYHPSQGCTLLPEDASGVSFEPTVVPPALDEAPEQEWPMGDVDAVDHDPDSVDGERLSTVLDRAVSEPPTHGMPPRTRALVVVTDGEIVDERYASGFDERTRHVTASAYVPDGTRASACLSSRRESRVYGEEDVTSRAPGCSPPVRASGRGGCSRR